jgi:hypothetical protein
MILDLDKIKKVENKYAHNPVVLDALRTMVHTVASGISDGTAIQTLLDLGCIREEKSEPQQLNS